MLRNLRYASRMLRKNLAFTLVAVCSLAIGIGANSAIFSIADGLLLRPVPVAKSSDVLNVVSSSPTVRASNVSYRDYIDIRDRNRSFDGLIAYSLTPLGLSQRPGVPAQLKYGFFVSGNFFRVLGVEPSLGRGFRPDEDKVPGRDAVAVLSHDLWASEFGADASVIGRKIRLNGTEFTIVGVAPEKFTGMDQYVRPALYVPIAMSPRLGDNVLERRELRWLNVKGRIKPGVTVAQAQADVASIAHALEQTYPSTNHNQTARVIPELQLRIEQDPPDAQIIAMLVVLAACVLLVACANVAGLLLSRSRARAREIAVRLAIGARRGSLIQQLLLENLFIALLGGTAGIAIGYAGITFFSQIQIPTDLPISLSVQMDHRVLLFTFLISVGSTVVFGLTPAFRSTRSDLVPALKAADADVAGRQRLWGRNLLVIGQIAVSLVLLTVSALMFRGFEAQIDKGPGYRTDHLLMMSFNPGVIRYNDAQTAQFYKQLLENTRASSGVTSAALTRDIPLSPNQNMEPLVPEGHQLARGQEAINVFSSTVSDRYFETTGLTASGSPDRSEHADVRRSHHGEFLSYARDQDSRDDCPDGGQHGRHGAASSDGGAVRAGGVFGEPPDARDRNSHGHRSRP